VGKAQREKGKRFEREWATELRTRFPAFADQIHRAIQSRGPEAADVLGLPGFWFECQDSIDPTPLKKLEQAERDQARSGLDLVPIAITHRSRSRSIEATLRLGDLQRLAGAQRVRMLVLGPGRLAGNLPVTIDASALLDLIAAAAPWDR